MAQETKETVLGRMTACGVIAVIRAGSTEPLLDVGRALLAGGVVSIEVTMTTPGALDGIRMMSQHLGGEAIVGVGTVLDAETCRRAISAGAQYVVSPHFDPQIVSATRELGKVSMPGAFTPTEILRAWAAGADVVKVFPSASVGTGFLRDVLAPLPHVKLMPTGGVDPKNAGEWIKAGAVCVGAGGAPMPKEALAKKNWGTITPNARAKVESVRKARAARTNAAAACP